MTMLARSLALAMALAWLASPAQASTWIRATQKPGDGRANALAATPDGGLLVAGESEGRPLGMRDAWLIRLEPDGTQSFRLVLDAQADEIATSVLAAADGGFVLAGERRDAGGFPFPVL